MMGAQHPAGIWSAVNPTVGSRPAKLLEAESSFYILGPESYTFTFLVISLNYQS